MLDQEVCGDLSGLPLVTLIVDTNLQLRIGHGGTQTLRERLQGRNKLNGKSCVLSVCFSPTRDGRWVAN